MGIRLQKKLNRAIALHKQGKLGEAENRYREILEIEPDDPDALHLKGMLHKGRGELAMAIRLISRSITLRPKAHDSRYNLGNCYLMAHVYPEAEECFRIALMLKPDFYDARRGLGHALFGQSDYQAAARIFRECIESRPADNDAHFGLGASLVYLGADLKDAVQSLEKALEAAPQAVNRLIALFQAKSMICEWRGLDDLRMRILRAVEAGSPCPPFQFLALGSSPQLERQNAGVWWQQMVNRLPSVTTIPTRVLDPNKSPLVLGYLSADFHGHATAYLAAELFGLHDRSRFKVVAYSYGPDDGSAIRQRIVAGCDRFHDIRGRPAHDVARLMAEDGVDILVDLKGFTGGFRPDLLALRPAPVIVHYLGYPGTLGGAVDYLIADPVVTPSGDDKYFSEILIRLPGCYQINDRHRSIAAAGTRCDHGLPNKGFVFCNFNTPGKITPEVFDIWMRLLRDVPDSVLWLLDGFGSAADNLRSEAAIRGISPNRLVFAPPQPHAAHLGRYRLADIFLDTWPVGAHTTASDALWAGCPVVTRIGDSFISRVAASILTSLDMPQLIAPNAQEYEERARKIALESGALADLRLRLNKNLATATVFDPERTTRLLEQAYALAWRHRASASGIRA